MSPWLPGVGTGSPTCLARCGPGLDLHPVLPLHLVTLGNRTSISPSWDLGDRGAGLIRGLGGCCHIQDLDHSKLLFFGTDSYRLSRGGRALGGGLFLL